MLEPPYQLIGERLRRGRAIPVLGAGASLTGRPADFRFHSPDDPYLPRADELAAYLMRYLGASAGDSADSLPRAALYAEALGGPQQLNDDLHDVFAPRRVPGPLHRYLAGVPGNLLIITTNYDALIETAFEEANRPYELCVYDNRDAPTLLVRRPGEPARPCDAGDYLHPEDLPTIFKMHGSVAAAPAQDSYVITDEDYVRFLWRMTGNSAVPQTFAEPLRRGCFLFLGYSLRDWNFRVLLYELARRFSTGLQSWAIQRDSPALDHDFWLRRDIRIFDMDLDAFAERLAQAWPDPAVGAAP